MAFKGKVIINPKVRNQIKFIQTGKDSEGVLLEMEATYSAHSKEPAAHYHPYQLEDFTILSGEMTVRMDGKIQVLKTGDTLHIPMNKVHSMWNNSDQKTIVNWKVQPALNTEYFLETAMGLSNENKTNDEGMPNILQVALMANKYTNEFRLVKPPFIIQKVLFFILTPFAYLFGYKPIYKKYID